VREAAIELDVKRMLARELHDRVAQTLTGMLVDLENFKAQQVGWDDVLKELDVMQSSTRQVLASLRQLLHELRGEQDSGDFRTNLDEMITRFEQRSGIGVVLDVKDGWPGELAPAASLNLCRILDEALNNVHLHSGGRVVKVVFGSLSDKELYMLIADDGRGIRPGDSHLPGLGTIGMRERALLLGGQLKVESTVGEGTIVTAVFPLAHVERPTPAWSAPLMVADSVSA
jgi:signal transduction histidine kinase